MDTIQHSHKDTQSTHNTRNIDPPDTYTEGNKGFYPLTADAYFKNWVNISVLLRTLFYFD